MVVYSHSCSVIENKKIDHLSIRKCIRMLYLHLVIQGVFVCSDAIG